MCVPYLIRWQHQHLQELRIRRQGGEVKGVVFGKGCHRKTRIIPATKKLVLKKKPMDLKKWERYIHFVENNTRCE